MGNRKKREKSQHNAAVHRIQEQSLEKEVESLTANEEYDPLDPNGIEEVETA